MFWRFWGFIRNMFLLLLLSSKGCSHPSIIHCWSGGKIWCRLAILWMVFPTVLANLAQSKPPKLLIGSWSDEWPQTSKTKLHWGLWAMKLESDRFMEILRKEGNIESIKHRDIWRIKKGRAVESKPTGIRTFIRTPMFTWTQHTKQLKNKHCSYERQLFTSENEGRLRTLFVKGAASTAPGKPEQNLRFLFADVCANIGHMVVWQLCTLVQQTKLLSMSQTLDMEQMQRHALKSTKLHLGKLHVLLPCFYLRSTCRKIG